MGSLSVISQDSPDQPVLGSSVTNSQSPMLRSWLTSQQRLSSPSDGVCTVVCLEAAPLPGLSSAPDVKELSLFGLPSTLLGKQLKPNKHVWSLSE